MITQQKDKTVYVIQLKAKEKTYYQTAANPPTEKSIKLAQRLQAVLQSLNKLGYSLELSETKVTEEVDPRQTTVPFPTN